MQSSNLLQYVEWGTREEVLSLLVKWIRSRLNRVCAGRISVRVFLCLLDPIGFAVDWQFTLLYGGVRQTFSCCDIKQHNASGFWTELWNSSFCLRLVCEWTGIGRHRHNAWNPCECWVRSAFVACCPSTLLRWSPALLGAFVGVKMLYPVFFFRRFRKSFVNTSPSEEHDFEWFLFLFLGLLFFSCHVFSKFGLKVLFASFVSVRTILVRTRRDWHRVVKILKCSS